MSRRTVGSAGSVAAAQHDRHKEAHVSARPSNNHPTLFPVALMLAGASLLLPSAFAQAPAPQDRAAAIKQALAQNQAALRQYTWIETTDIILKGEEKKQEQKQCFYGADGKVQKTPIAGEAPSSQQQEGGRRRGGRVKEDVVAHKIEEMKEYMAKVVALVHEYVPPDAQKIKAAEAAGNLSLAPSPGVTTLTVKNYVKPGDSLALALGAGGKIQSFNVRSYVEKPDEDAVTLAVTFASLEDGTNYPQTEVVDVAAKKIEVRITNSGYKKTGS
jgi:hypothetical protein